MRRGLYSGKHLGEDGAQRDVHVGLCCSPSGDVGVWGVVLLDGGGELGLLKGAYDAGKQTAEIEVKFTEGGWAGWGAVEVSEDTLKGRKIVAVKDEESQVLGGFWGGEAACNTPYIPTNPIQWYLTILDTGKVMGCGFFTDSADVKDKPILFYKLEGDYDGETHKITVRKTYEETETTIVYTGEADVPSGTVRGDWENQTHDTTGTFHAKNLTESSDSLICCRFCSRLIPPGRLRFSCGGCYSHFCVECDHRGPCCDVAVVPSSPPTLRCGVEITPVHGDTCREIVSKCFEKFTSRPVVNDVNDTWTTYGELYPLVRSFAHQLQQHNATRIAIFSKPCQSYLVKILGAILSGVTIVPVAVQADLADFAERYSASHVVDSEGHIEACGGDVKEIMSQPPICILFTSGTTGRPKGVPFSNELCLPTEGTTTVYPYIRYDFQEYDPTFILSVLSTVQCGGSRYVKVGCDAREMSVVMNKIRPTHFGAPPSVWNAIRKCRQGGDLGGRLHVATVGGAATDPELLRWLRDDRNIDVADLYGCREVGGIAKNGFVYPGVSCLLPNGEDQGVGELCVSSPRMVSKYYEGGEEKFVEIDGKVFYKTGDVAEVWREEGGRQRVNVLGRVGAVVKTSDGRFTNPGDVEMSLEKCENVIAACCWIDDGVVKSVCHVTKVTDTDSLRTEMLSNTLPSTTLTPAIIFQTMTPFSTTPTGKTRRNDVISHYSTITRQPPHHPTTIPTPIATHLPWVESTTLPLSSCGCTSLVAAQICGDVKEEFGVEVTPGMVLEGSVEWLAAVIKTKKTVRKIEEGWEYGREVLKGVELFKNELEENRARVGNDARKKPRAVVVFGSGGFFGPVLTQYHDHGINLINLSRKEVPGFDLTKPLCGIPLDLLQLIENSDIEAVVINAAWVSLTLGFSTLYEVNVAGAVRCAALAVAVGTKKIIFISSYSAMMGPGEALQNRDDNKTFHRLSGYGQTKAVAEGILHRINFTHGVDVSVVRPPTIFPDRKSRVVSHTDALSILVKTCHTTKSFPSGITGSIPLAPADYIARLVSRLCQAPPTARFIICNIPSTPVPFSKFFSSIPSAAPVSLMSWSASVREELKHHPLAGIIVSMVVAKGETPAEITCGNTLEVMKGCGCHPRVEEADVETMVAAVLEMER